MKRQMMIVALCLFCLGVSTAGARQLDPCEVKGGYINTEGKCVLRAQLSISIDYPLDLAQTPLVADTIDPFIQASKAEIIGYFTESFAYSPGPYELTMTYDTVRHSNNVFTLVFSTYEYSGGAHGNDTTQTYTFDLANNRLVTLDDLFAPNSDPFVVIAPIVEADLAQKVGDYSTADWIYAGSGDNPDNYQRFALDVDALIFYFPPYQVAAYVAGSQTVTIPLVDLSAILAPEFAP